MMMMATTIVVGSVEMKTARRLFPLLMASFRVALLLLLRSLACQFPPPPASVVVAIVLKVNPHTTRLISIQNYYYQPVKFKVR